jgi:hypothetical protein
VLQGAATINLATPVLLAAEIVPDESADFHIGSMDVDAIP